MGGGEETMRFLCSHGGRLVPCGPDAGLHYVGGDTRALVVPRDVAFRDLRARLAEKAGAAVNAVRYRLADDGLDEDLLVSVTCDEELAHMRDEYDRLKATRPTASFRVFVSTAGAGAHQRRPPLAPPMMRRTRSEQDLSGRACPCPRPPAGLPAAPPMRRVHSAQELAGGSHSHPCSCGVLGKAVFSDSERAMEKDTSEDAMVAMELENRRACWEFE
ncbi:uncharacterized protein LOC121053831 [Oryza brachyantha]|uniref:uncharacterized protein LOC121053831 n=1 Tax=Oryza brachyantha TaxID=4533 RepID=UPI001ADBBC25|nr:uncharacterized protein LOC121053831 [Oryza brachyantha]